MYIYITYTYIYIYIYIYYTCIYIYHLYVIERSLEVKLPTLWTDETAEVFPESEKGRRKMIRERVRSKKMQVHEKVEKSRMLWLFQCFVTLK